MSKIEIHKNSITNLHTDAVVNAANSHLKQGSGVCGFIFKAAGEAELAAECNKIGHCSVGNAVITAGCKMQNKYIIHAVGPDCRKVAESEREGLLYGAYYQSLERARENDVHSVGFPLISTGVFAYPVEEAWKVALNACMDFIEKNAGYEITIVFVRTKDEDVALGKKIMVEVEAERTACKTEELHPVYVKRSADELRDRSRGCLIGGAAGDALGYPIEFDSEDEIREAYGPYGITSYCLNEKTGKALISDDTQMTLFTANGVIFRETRGFARGVAGAPYTYIAMAYQDWLITQNNIYMGGKQDSKTDRKEISWLLDVPELYSRRAPGNTCLSALQDYPHCGGNLLENPRNDSKGCGGVMRVAPLGFCHSVDGDDMLTMEGARTAAITHGHSLGYMPAALLVRIIHNIVYTNLNLEDCVREANVAVARLFASDPNVKTLTGLIELAAELAKNSDSDIDNIHSLGKGWVGEEALAIAVYCSLRHADDFSAGIIAAVNHKGDSDSTGAITGNILGARLGYSKIPEKWKENLELKDVILEIADDLVTEPPIDDWDGSKSDPIWVRKYIECRRAVKETEEFVFFWKDHEDNSYLSQWYTAPFVIEGIRYENCEQYVMAKKALLCGDLGQYKKIMDDPDPKTVKTNGKQVAGYDADKWHAAREEVAYNANLAKFTQNPELEKRLKATGNATLAEASPKDTVWGIGLTADDPAAREPKLWKGTNLLGKVLERVRKELQMNDKEKDR